MLKDKYKLLKYNYTKIVKNVCIYNTFTDAVIILNKCEYDKFIQFYEFNEDDADINTWINQGLIIPNTLDETAMVNYNRARDTFTQKTATYRILTTTCCNARCFYCYEDGIQPITMTIDIANRVADFIINKSRDKKRIALNWFGGEPLLNPDIITIITQKIESG